DAGGDGEPEGLSTLLRWLLGRKRAPTERDRRHCNDHRDLVFAFPVVAVFLAWLLRWIQSYPSSRLQDGHSCWCCDKVWCRGKLEFCLNACFRCQENGDITGENTVLEAADNNETERSIRRRQKTDAPEFLLKEDSNGGFSGRVGKAIAPRPKPGSRTDTDTKRLCAILSGDSIRAEGLFSVRKSSSTSCLQSQDPDTNSSLWPTTKWILKPDVLARPIFDGLPKSMTAKRNKTALD
ncbi:hypothetical protein GW17_00035333, partial [Ensete ventricosum]